MTVTAMFSSYSDVSRRTEPESYASHFVMMVTKCGEVCLEVSVHRGLLCVSIEALIIPVRRMAGCCLQAPTKTVHPLVNYMEEKCAFH